MAFSALVSSEKRIDFEVFNNMPVRKCVNRIPSSPVKNILEEEAAPMKQGIVTILGSDCETGKAGSIRRTLSADMSSKKWLQQNGFFPPMKKIVSSEALVRSSEEEEDDEIPNQDEVWRSIQAQKEIDQMHKPAQVQVWGLLLTQKSENSTLPPPYIHPLVKTSASSLSGKSLEICTESLGSETGSDCFSTYSCSEILTDGEEDKEDRQRVVAEELNDSNSFPELHVAQYKKSPARPFPPPLPSIAGGDGSSLHMHSHRENGRLVVEAVSVPPRNYFHAQRHDGRLLLTLVHAPAAPSDEVGESERVFGDMEEVEEEEEYDDDGGGDEVEEKDEGFVMKHKLSLHSGMIGVDKSCLVMKKLIPLRNINPTWPKKMNKVDEEELPITHSLPPPHPATRLIQHRPPPTAASFNSYVNFWKNKNPASGSMITHRSPNKMNVTKGYENQDLVVLRGDKTEQFVPYFRGCKEARRSPLSWEPYCIATS